MSEESNFRSIMYSTIISQKWLRSPEHKWLLILQFSTSLWCFRPRTFFLKKKTGLDWLPWTPLIFYVHAIFRIISSSVSGAATDSMMNHLPHVRWSNFIFMFLNGSWCVSLTWWRRTFYWCLVFSLAQAALWMVQSICTSGVITRNDVHTKSQGQSSKHKVSEVKKQLRRFLAVTPVWIHIWLWNDA